MYAGRPVASVLKPNGGSAETNAVIWNASGTSAAPTTPGSGFSTTRIAKVHLFWRIVGAEAVGEVGVWVWSVAALAWVPYCTISCSGMAGTERGGVTLTVDGVSKIAFNVVSLSAGATLSLWAEKVEMV